MRERRAREGRIFSFRLEERSFLVSTDVSSAISVVALRFELVREFAREDPVNGTLLDLLPLPSYLGRAIAPL